MPIYTASGEVAFRNLQAKPCGRWHRQGASPDDPDGQLAFQRLRPAFFTPQIRPKFHAHRDDHLFAIGSCFARGIESALLSRKCSVLSAAAEFASFAAVGPQLTGLGFTNKYNTYSIANELGWALDPMSEFPVKSIVDLPAGLAYDPHTNPTLPPADRAETLRRRQISKR